jgi:predicted transcriptional regulator of viral defense system
MSELKRTVADWIRELPRRGKLFFSLDEIISAFPAMTRQSVRAGLDRQIAKREIQSVWRGFYGILVYDYGLRKVIPPSDYIDLLMKHLNRNYYVALLSAAALHGAAHQASQTFMVMIGDNSMRMKEGNGVRIEFFTRKQMPQHYTEKIMTKTGYMTVSTPELTALDLVARMQRVGGLNRVVEVLDELAENMDFSKVSADYFALSTFPVIQRLGYLLDSELGFVGLADQLYGKAIATGQSIKPTLLVAYKKPRINQPLLTNQRWQVVLNEKVDKD